MKIAVVIKRVPDTETVIKINADASGIEEAGAKFVMGPYDEFAVEEALRTKEKAGGGEVVVVSLGPDSAVETIRTALAMGCDRAIHLNDAAFQGGDGAATAKALAAAIKSVEAELVFGGKQAIDGDQAQVGPRIAEHLGMGHASMAVGFELSDDKSKAKVVRRIEGGEEVIELTLPALITCDKGLNEPRYASLPGIMKAKKKEVKAVGPGDLGLDAGSVGAAGAKAKRVKLMPLPERPPGKMIPADDPAQAAHELVKLLREEAKVL